MWPVQFSFASSVEEGFAWNKHSVQTVSPWKRQGRLRPCCIPIPVAHLSWCIFSGASALIYLVHPFMCYLSCTNGLMCYLCSMSCTCRLWGSELNGEITWQPHAQCWHAGWTDQNSFSSLFINRCVTRRYCMVQNLLRCFPWTGLSPRFPSYKPNRFFISIYLFWTLLLKVEHQKNGPDTESHGWCCHG